MATVKFPEPLIFGLDIGTRSIVGTVGYKEKNKFHVVAMSVKYHDTRSMIDGQIHDIPKVSEDILQVKEDLERQLRGRKLHDVCIAAAGRVLKTAVGHGEYEFSENTVITQEYIHSIDLIGVERAHDVIFEELAANKEATKFYCVGYTPIKYFLNNYEISNLEGHKGTKIGADILATFLPEEVVTSLYSAVEMAGLYVTNLTLEPIAAIELAIPEQYRLLNIALVDVGAGTSDISITKDGSIVGYGMIPSAGDELTEMLVKRYLVDFNTAEDMKLAVSKSESVPYADILGNQKTTTSEEILSIIDVRIKEITSKIAQKIIELNGGEAISAVFVVGGGGKIPGFTEYLADALKLPTERVALRGKEVMNDVELHVDALEKDSLYVTPIGICLNFYDQKNDFVFVTVNGERVKLYNNDKLTIFDAAVQYGLPKEAIFPKRGDDINFKINGKSRIVRGYDGEAAVISCNGHVVGMNSPIEANDRIEIKESTKGISAQIVLGSLPEYKGTLTFIVNNKQITCPKFALVNGYPQSESYEICDGDDVIMQNYYTLEQLFTFMDIEPVFQVEINQLTADLQDRIYDNFVVSWNDGTNEKMHENEHASVGDSRKWNAYDGKIIDEKVNDEITLENTSIDDTSAQIHDMRVFVNKQPIDMKGKANYYFVDIFDYIDFDLKTVRGSRLVTNIDGHRAAFIEELHEDAVVDIYWEK
ncbi:MAG: cell division FtsA domain-containing protein [Eubacteriales bacterium]|nr:cell division FtsA domain-containing protein [Eubacteriales bacterium]